MEGFAWIAIVGLWWVVATVMKGAKQSNNAAKNKQQQTARVPQAKAAPRAKPASPPAPKPQPAAMSRSDEWEDEEQSWDERDAKRGQQSVTPRVAPRPAQPAAKHTGAKPFEAHMHTPTMGVEGVGTEGIDCCHDFMLGEIADSEPADFLPMQEEEQSERAKALLQGVIYSEILGRRAVKRYSVKQP